MKVAVLMYHRVGESRGQDFAASPGQFERQMDVITSAGYRIIELGALVAAIETGTPIVGKVAILTFDDGFLDTCDTVCPVLHTRGFPATFFLIAGQIGQSAEWLSERHRLIDWRQARQLKGEGFAVGSHSVTHSRLTQLPEGGVRDEIVRSKRLLEDGIGSEIPFFAYPYGDCNERVRDLVAEAGYRGACSTASGFNDLRTDRFSLRRIDISGNYSIAKFRRSLTFGENEMPLGREIGYYSRRLLSAFSVSR